MIGMGCRTESPSGSRFQMLKAVPGNPAVVIQSGWQPPFSLWQACAGEPASVIRAGRAKPSPCSNRLRKNGLGLLRLARGGAGAATWNGNRRA